MHQLYCGGRALVRLGLLFALVAGVAQAQSRGLGHWVIQPPAVPYVGIAINTDSAYAPISRFEQTVGRVMAIHINNKFNLPGSGVGKFADITESALGDDCRYGRISLIDLSPGKLNATAVANGQYDSQYVIPAAHAAKALGCNVMIRIWREMNVNITGNNANGNGGAFSSQDIGADQREYIAFYQHIVNVFIAQGATNVTWVWCPATGPLLGERLSSESTIAGFYPGDQYVDWTCADAYNKSNRRNPGGVRDAAAVWGAGNPHENPAALLAHFGKPAVLAETGSCNNAQPSRKCPGNPIMTQAQFISQMQSAMSPGGFLYPTVKGIVYFSINDSFSGFNWDLDPQGLSAFRSLALADNPSNCTTARCSTPRAVWRQ